MHYRKFREDYLRCRANSPELFDDHYLHTDANNGVTLERLRALQALACSMAGRRRDPLLRSACRIMLDQVEQYEHDGVTDHEVLQLLHPAHRYVLRIYHAERVLGSDAFKAGEPTLESYDFDVRAIRVLLDSDETYYADCSSMGTPTRKIKLSDLDPFVLNRLVGLLRTVPERHYRIYMSAAFKTLAM